MIGIYSRRLPPRACCLDLFGIGSAIGGVASAAGTALAAKRNLEATRETNATNLQLAREQNDWNLAQWNRENEYNTTKNQLDRWVAAGLNPHSFASNSAPSLAAASPESAELANQQAPDFSMFGNAAGQFASAIGGFADYALKSRQLDQEDRKLDQTDTQLGINTRLAESQISSADKMRRNMDAEFNKIVADTDVSKSVADVNRAELRRIAAQTDVYLAQFDNITSNTKLMNLEFAFKQKTFKTRVAQVAADLKKTYSDIAKNTQDIAESVQRVCLMAYDKQLKSQEIDLNGLNIHMYRTRNNQLDFNFSMDQKWRNMERANQIFVERCKAFSALLGGVSSLSSFLPYGRSSRVTDAMLGANMTSPPASWSQPQGVTQFY